MKRFVPHRKLVWALLLPLLFVACDNDEEELFRSEAPTLNIIESAQNTESLSNLTAAMAKVDQDTKSDLANDLSDSGPFIAFALIDDLLYVLKDRYPDIQDFDTPVEKALLTLVLAYQMVEGTNLFCTDLTDHKSLSTV